MEAKDAVVVPEEPAGAEGEQPPRASPDWDLMLAEDGVAGAPLANGGEGGAEAASPRVRLTQARLLDDRLYSQSLGAEDGGMAEELGNLMVNDGFDMLIRKNEENNDDILRDMDSAISDLQKWREIRNRDLALELEGMRPPGELGAPETDEDDSAGGRERGDCGIEADEQSEYRRADDKAIESLETLLRSPRSSGADRKGAGGRGAPDSKEDDVRALLDKQTQKIKFSQIEQQVRELQCDEATLKLQRELLEMEMAEEAGMGALSSQLKGFESELDSFLERTK